MPWSSPLVDMEMDDESQLDHPMPIKGDREQYPYGLRICLCDAELKKLGLDADCDVGDTFEFRAQAAVTNVSKGDMGKRVELQIQKMAAESDGEMED